MSLLTEFKTKLASFLETVKDEVSDFAHYFLPQVGHLVEVALEELAEVAGQAVLAQAPKVLSGQVKFGNAVSQVIDTVKAEGKTVAEQTAAAAVQLAYLEIQKLVAGK